MLTSTVALFTLLSLTTTVPPTSPPPGGGEESAWLSTVGTSSLTVTATQTTPAPRGDSAPRGRKNGSAAPKPADPCATVPYPYKASCGIYGVRVTSADGDPLTISDLARFAPEPVATAAEPGGVGVAGLPTNFVTAATAHTQQGTILDLAVTVRFTPVAFDTTFGDGTSATTATGGRTWAAAHQPQFTPTPTSHVYRDRGTYTAVTTVRYTAEVDLGNGWFPVAGELSVAGPAHSIRIYEARSALVRYTCDEQPTAAGC